MHHGYTQAEGVANLWEVPETGALVIIGYPKFGGGLGGYARFVAVCPPDWPLGTTIGPADRRCRNRTCRCIMRSRPVCAFVESTKRERTGGSDGARTRDLRRDRPTL